MVYSNKFVVSVLLNGIPQKELANGVVKIPFGEYTLRFRNKHKDRRALVKFFIDGEEASGGGYVIPANDCVDIERWSDKAVKFNFVSLDSPEAVDFGKNGPNEDKVKGTIEARFYLEKEYPTFTTQPVTEIHHHHHYPKPRPAPLSPWKESWPTMGNPYQTWDNFDYRAKGSSVGDAIYCSNASNSLEAVRSQKIEDLKLQIIAQNPAILGVPLNDAPLQDGCTVEGSHSSQTFRTVRFEAETDYVALKVFLQGYDIYGSTPPGKHSFKVEDGSKHKITLLETEEEVMARRLRELEEENKRLKKLAEVKALKEQNEENLRKLEEENKKLRESLGI